MRRRFEPGFSTGSEWLDHRIKWTAHLYRTRLDQDRDIPKESCLGTYPILKTDIHV